MRNRRRQIDEGEALENKAPPSIPRSCRYPMELHAFLADLTVPVCRSAKGASRQPAARALGRSTPPASASSIATPRALAAARSSYRRRPTMRRGLEAAINCPHCSRVLKCPTVRRIDGIAMPDARTEGRTGVSEDGPPPDRQAPSSGRPVEQAPRHTSNRKVPTPAGPGG